MASPPRPRRIHAVLAGLLVAWTSSNAGEESAGPSFPCADVEDGSIESLVCGDETLSALDRKLSEVYTAASARARNEHPPVLKAEQRGWIKGRNECWKSVDTTDCVRQAYRTRIAELQARYALVPAEGPFFYTCDGNPAKEVVATFFSSDPPTLVAELGDQVSLMYRQTTADEASYAGRNESFREAGGRALISWGYGAAEMVCEPSPR